MTRAPFIALTVCLSAFLARTLHAEDAQPSSSSVLIKSTPLKQGHLPRLVMAYGRVVANSAAAQAIMAPLTAVVDEVYVRQGETIDQGAPLVRLSPGPKTLAAYSQAKTAVAAAKDLFARTRRLLAEHLATDQQLVTAQKSLTDAQLELAAEQQQGAAGPHVLKAPFKAIITGVETSAGSIVSEGAALLTLARPTGLVLKVGVVPARATLIKPGDSAKVTPIGGGDPIDGEVVLRSAIVGAANGMVATEIKLPPDKFLLGEMATAEITTGEASGYVVPHEALLVDRRGRAYVMQVVKGAAKKVLVRVIDSNTDSDVISGPLAVSAPVVLSGAYQLRDGAKVRYARSKQPKGEGRSAPVAVQR